MKAKQVFKILIMLMMILSMIGCIADVKYPSVDSVEISPDKAILSMGGTQQFRATVKGQNNPPQTVTWSISGNNSANTSINSNGLLTVASNETAIALTIQAVSNYDESKIGTAIVGENDIAIGDIIAFGANNWRVLDIQSTQALIVSENVIELRAYHTSYTTITWASSSIRTYLNGTFYNSSAFSNADRLRIVEKTIPNENNQWYGTDGGQSTSDRIFLLSISEVVKYFGDSGQLANRPGDASYISDQYNSARTAKVNGLALFCWLRSPGAFSYDASAVSYEGSILIHGVGVSFYFGGVRPALWINL